MFDRRLIALVAFAVTLSGIAAWAGGADESPPWPEKTLPSPPEPLGEKQVATLPKNAYAVEVGFNDGLVGPKVICLAGQQAEVVTMTQRPFVTAIEQKAGKTTPHVEVIEEGSRVTCIVREGVEGFVTLDLTIARPEIEEVATRHDVQAVRVECPTTRVIQPVRLGQRVSIPFGDDEKAVVSVVVTRPE